MNLAIDHLHRSIKELEAKLEHTTRRHGTCKVEFEASAAEVESQTATLGELRSALQAVRAAAAPAAATPASAPVIDVTTLEVKAPSFEQATDAAPDTKAASKPVARKT